MKLSHSLRRSGNMDTHISLYGEKLLPPNTRGQRVAIIASSINLHRLSLPNPAPLRPVSQAQQQLCRIIQQDSINHDD